MRVLLVEKDHAVRDVVKVALQQFDGVIVDTAEDSWALELAKENEYTVLVIADRLEESGDGLALMGRLRDLGLSAPAMLLSRESGNSTMSRELPTVAAVLPVPPDPVAVFQAIAAIQQRLTSRTLGG